MHLAAVFLPVAGRKWPRSSSFMAVACILLVLLVFSHLALCSRRLPAGAVVAHATDHGKIVKVIRDVEQIVASCRRSLISWEVTAAAVPPGCGCPCYQAATWGFANSESASNSVHRAV